MTELQAKQLLEILRAIALQTSRLADELKKIREEGLGVTTYKP